MYSHVQVAHPWQSVVDKRYKWDARSAHLCNCKYTDKPHKIGNATRTALRVALLSSEIEFLRYVCYLCFAPPTECCICLFICYTAKTRWLVNVGGIHCDHILRAELFCITRAKLHAEELVSFARQMHVRMVMHITGGRVQNYRTTVLQQRRQQTTTCAPRIVRNQ